jgi:hypothetical protein
LPGVRYVSNPLGGPDQGEWEIAVRFALLLPIGSVLPMLWIHKSAPRRRNLRGMRCVTCGYDLRATPDRCPECGSVPAEAAGAKVAAPRAA